MPLNVPTMDLDMINASFYGYYVTEFVKLKDEKNHETIFSTKHLHELAVDIAENNYLNKEYLVQFYSDIPEQINQSRNYAAEKVINQNPDATDDDLGFLILEQFKDIPSLRHDVEKNSIMKLKITPEFIKIGNHKDNGKEFRFTGYNFAAMIYYFAIGGTWGWNARIEPNYTISTVNSMALSNNTFYAEAQKKLTSFRKIRAHSQNSKLNI